MQSPRDTSDWPMLHGQSDANYVTLLDTGMRAQDGGFAFAPPSNQIISVRHALVGVGLDGSEEAAFHGLELEVDDLLDWSNLSALPIQHEMTEGKLAHKSTGTVNPIPGLKAEWDGLKISLDIATTTFDDRPVDPNTRAATSRGAP